MLNYRATLLGTVLAIVIAPVAFSQETEATAGTSETGAPTIAECEADFATLDLNGDGYLSEAEASRAFARARVDGVTLQEEGISKEEYTSLCGSSEWAEHTPEEGAPFAGANSFTEEQARDRAVAWNVIEVSPLTKDDNGIWRGTGKLNGAPVSVAIDYKGNVVTAAANP